MIMQITSTELEAGLGAGFISLDSRKAFKFSTRASTLLLAMIISCHSNAAPR